MLLAAQILTTLVLLIHVYIVLIETVLFKSRGRRIFGMDAAKAEALAPLMSNQGCYNGFLVAALALGLFAPLAPATAQAFVWYGLGCVLVAGLWGAATVGGRILQVQALPAALALGAWGLALHGGPAA